MPQPVLALHLSAVAHAPAMAVRAAAPWLRASSVPDTATSNALLVITELVTDGVLRGGGDIDVRAEVEGQALFIHVTTPLRAGQPPTVQLGFAEENPLSTVGACCDVVDIRDDSSGLRHVVCTIALR